MEKIMFSVLLFGVFVSGNAHAQDQALCLDECREDCADLSGRDRGECNSDCLSECLPEEADNGLENSGHDLDPDECDVSIYDPIPPYPLYILPVSCGELECVYMNVRMAMSYGWEENDCDELQYF